MTEVQRKRPQIYLAGPMVFYPDMDSVFKRMKEICAEHGMQGVAPYEGQHGLEGVAPGRALYTKIVGNDFALIDACDGMIACLDPFHGSIEMDAGTAVEVGYAHAKQKPMTGWTQEAIPYGKRIEEVFGLSKDTATANAEGATSGTRRDGKGLLIHSAELVQHGMAQMPIEMSGGKVFASENWEQAFAQAVIDMKKLLSRDKQVGSLGAQR